MGASPLSRKRGAKGARGLARSKAYRAPYEKVLIVCEGEKTEPLYFRALRDHYKINSANIEICGNCVSDPLGIIRHAKNRYREEKDAGDPFDRVFCVFDKDAHVNYLAAVGVIRGATPKGSYFAITSVPCFEYWLLLHFTYTTKPYDHLPGNSACEQVQADLRRYIRDYKKGSKEIFHALRDRLDVAKQNAARGLQEAEAGGADNPTTLVHNLVEYLQNIKRPA